MDWEIVLKSLDELVFQHTGKHLNNLQSSILKGVLSGQKYADIAKKYRCTAGHVKDEGYELWQLLSAALGEDLNKSNFCATIERLGIANSNSKLINPIQIGHLSLCASSEPLDPNIETTSTSPKSTVTPEQQNTITKLLDFGLNPQQIADVLNLQVEQIQNFAENPK